MTLLEILTPINIKEEERKFFNSKHYNPIFKYAWQNKKNIKLGTNKIELKKAVLDQDYEKIIKQSKIAFQVKINKVNLDTAKKIIQNRPNFDIDRSKKSIESEFKKVFSVLNLDYKIRITQDSGYLARPKQSQKLILIGNNIQNDLSSLSNFIKHEISHIIRYENSKYNLISRDKDYLGTEEGLASYVQDYTSSDGQISL